MNLLLLEDEQFLDHSRAFASQRQSQHIQSILRLSIGDSLLLGRINGNIGRGVIAGLGNRVEIRDIVLDRAPPAQLPVTLILSMPRPQMLKRILQTIACMGVEKICFLQSGRVEKSFWQSPSAEGSAMRNQLIQGLEQGVATQLPIIEKHQRFRPFVENQLDVLVRNSKTYIAHPRARQVCKEISPNQRLVLVVGPEGGFLEKEVDSFTRRGFIPVHLGKRILKVETAIPVLLAKVFPFT